MSRPTAQLLLHPDRCDQCGRCMAVCEHRALKVGVSYIYVDWRSCGGCYACVDACDRAAIEQRTDTHAATVPSVPSAGAKVVVIGSRAEAKAARRRAADAEKRALKQRRTDDRRHAVVSAVEQRTRGLDEDGMVAWGGVDAVAVLSVLLLSFLAKEAVLATTAFGVMPASGQVVARTLVLGAFYAVQLWLLGFLSARHGSGMWSAFGLGRLGRSWASKAAALGMVVGLLVATRLFSTAYGASVRALGWEPPSSAAGDLSAMFGTGGAGLALAVFMVAVIGPFTEELAFRGVILHALGERGGKWLAILLSAALFSAYHFTAWLLVPTFALGVAVGWMAWERRSLWPAIALHCLYNGTAVIAAFIVASS